MAAYPTTSHTNGVAAVSDLLNLSATAGYTPATACGGTDAIASILANILQGAPFAAGTVTAPAISTTGDTNTGVYFSAADKVDVTCGGVRAIRFNTATTGVNFADVTPAAASANPAIAAAGADTNISLALAGKGTGGVIVGGGTAFSSMQRLTATLTPAAIAANTAVEQTFTTFTGLTTADAAAYVQKAAQQGGLGIVGVRVVTTNNLGIHFQNSTGSAITPTAGEVYTLFAHRLGTDD